MPTDYAAEAKKYGAKYTPPRTSTGAIDHAAEASRYGAVYKPAGSDVASDSEVVGPPVPEQGFFGSLLNKVGKAALNPVGALGDIGKSGIKSTAKMAVNMAKLGKDALDATAGALTGGKNAAQQQKEEQHYQSFQEGIDSASLLKARTLPQGVADITGEIAAFLVPFAKVGTAAKAATALIKSKKFGSLLKIGLDSAGSAGLAGITSKDGERLDNAKTTGISSAALPIVAGAAKGIKKGLGYAIEEVKIKSTGLNKSTLDELRRPESLYNEAQKGDITRQGIFDDFKEALDTQRKEISSTGKVYDDIRSQEGNIPFATKDGNWLTQKIKDLGLRLEDGKISATSKSRVRDAADIRELQNLYDLYGGNKELTKGEFLNLRHDVSGAARYDKGVSDPFEAQMKGFRSELDTFGKEKIPGLKELDAKYSGLKKEIDTVRGMVYDKSGNIKDDAITKLFNYTKKSAEKQKVVEKLLPGINNKVRGLRALEDVEMANGNKVGTYSRSILTGGGILTGNPALAGLAIITSIVTNPKVAARIINSYAKANAKLFGLTAKSGAELADKIAKGETLSSFQRSAMKSIILWAEKNREQWDN